MFTIGLAYRGTANNAAIQKLLHFAVSDVSDDVRRAAVINLGFVLLNVPEQAPRIVSLLVRHHLTLCESVFNQNPNSTVLITPQPSCAHSKAHAAECAVYLTGEW